MGLGPHGSLRSWVPPPSALGLLCSSLSPTQQPPLLTAGPHGSVRCLLSLLALCCATPPHRVRFFRCGAALPDRYAAHLHGVLCWRGRHRPQSFSSQISAQEPPHVKGDFSGFRTKSTFALQTVTTERIGGLVGESLGTKAQGRQAPCTQHCHRLLGRHLKPRAHS